MADEKNIYGTINPDGTRVYPDVDLDGASFTQPATTINIGGNRFVVTPVNFSNWERLEEVKAQAPSAPRIVKASKEGE